MVEPIHYAVGERYQAHPDFAISRRRAARCLVDTPIRCVAAKLGGAHERAACGEASIRRLAELDVTVIERAVPARLAAGRLDLEGMFGEARPALDVDTVVVYSDGHPQAEVLRPLCDAGIAPLLIGDALRPRRTQDAVADGARVGREAPSPASLRGMATRGA